MEFKTKCTLICDTREKNVTRHSKDLETVRLEIKQITTGDYVVLAPEGNILAVIERKSLEDFSASLKDGRHKNKEKLVELRKQTGCRIIYIIEGPLNPKPTDYFGNIAYKNIESSIFHLMIRENITAIYTLDTLETAKTLSRFMHSMDSLCEKLEEPLESPENLKPVQITDKTEITSMLTRAHVASDHDLVRDLWSSFPGIAVESADEYMKYWSLSDIICDRVKYDDIHNFKLASGRKIGKKAATSLTHIDKIIQVRLLSRIPGVSHTVAVEMLKEYPLRNILSWEIGGMGMIIIGKNSRRLGDKVAERILRLFNYRYIKPVTLSVNSQVESFQQIITPNLEIYKVTCDESIDSFLDAL